MSGSLSDEDERIVVLVADQPDLSQVATSCA